MKFVAVVAAAAFFAATTKAYVASPVPRSSFVAGRSTGTRGSYSLRMDTEAPEIDYTARYKLEKILLQEIDPVDLRTAEKEHGMPWETSIDSKAFKDEELLYMPFWNHQVKFLEENLTNLKVMSCTNGKTDFSYKENKDKKARIVNLCLSSDEYRKIRLTYYDAGENTQVFNAVLYPDPAYNLPVLGVDLLAFNRKKYLAIVDFQPLHTTEADHDAEFSHLLKPIKESYENLSGRMSSKFYDETQFFSEQMLFARFEDENIIQKELFPAFQQYAQTHLDLIRAQDGSADSEFVLKRQQAYDSYSAERDPATGLFTAMFGQEFAMDYVHDFLFSMSKRPAPGTPPVMPAFMGGGGNPHAQGKPSGGNPPFAQTKPSGNPYARQQQPETEGARRR